MDSPILPTLLSPITPRLNPGIHTPSRPSSRPSIREHVTDDILTDLTPSTTFEAFTSPSGKLRESIEAASQSERAFGIRATLASKKIQEWVNELSSWPWPTESGSAGFEMPPAKRRKISDEPNMNGSLEVEYTGSLPTADALRYEVRIEEITGDMEDLNFEEIKRQVLDTHFSAKSRPSSSASSAPMPSFLSSYTKMDDFTAIVTATVLQALPNLSRLMRLMEVWSIRLAVLRKVPPLLTALNDVEVALKSGWSAMQVPENQERGYAQALSRNTFDVMKSVLQDKVTSLGQDLDYMLDTLEGRPDTLPDSWLDRMEAIEQDYGEWAVAGDRRVREGEWDRMAKARKEAEDARRAKEAEAARLKAENDAEVSRILAEEQAAKAAKRKAEEDATNARILAEKQAAEASKLKAEKDAEVARILADEQAAEAARRKAEQGAEDERLRAEQLAVEARLKTERDEASARILAQEQATEAAKRKADEDAANARTLQEEQIADAARRKAEQDVEDERLKAEELAEQVRLTEKDEEASRILAEEQAAKVEADEVVANATRLQEEEIADAARRKAEQDVQHEKIKAEQLAEKLTLKTEKDAEESRRLKAKEASEFVRQQVVKDAADAKRLEEEQALEAIRRKEESDAQDAERLKAEAAVNLAQQQARRDAEKAARIFEEEQALEAAQRQAELNAQNAEVARRQAIKDVENGEAAERDAKAEEERQNENSVNAAAAKKQPTHIAHPQILQRDEEAAIKMPPVSTTEAASTVVTPSIDTDSANESTYSPDFNLQLEKFSPFDGSSDIHPVDPDVPITHNQVLQSGQNGNAIPQPKGNKISRPANIKIPPANNLGNILQTPRTSSHLSNDAVQICKTPSTAPADNRLIQDRNSPSTPKSKLQLGHAFAKFIRHSLPSTPTEESSKRSLEFLKPSAISVPDSVCMNADHAPTPRANVFPEESTAAEETHQLLVIKSVGKVTDSPDPLLTDVPTESPQGIESADHIIASTETGDSELFEIDDSQLSIQHSRNSSVSGYSISQATPEILKAEPAEYFRPVLSPIESPRFSIHGSEPTTPTVSRTFVGDAGNLSFSTLDEDEEMSSSTPQKQAEVFPPRESTTLPSESEERDAEEVDFGDNLEDSLEMSQIGDSSTPLVARRSSLSPIDTGIKLILPTRPHSSSSETPTIVTGFEDNASTPMFPSPLSAERESFPEVEPESPSAGRVGTRNRISHDYSPPGSPAPMPAIRKRGSLPSPTSPTFSTLDQSDTSSLSIDAPTFSTSDVSDTSSLSMDAPIFDNVQVSADRSMNSGPTRTSNDQLEQQISSILDSIPTKIRLTSKPEAHQASTLRPKKPRRSVTPSLRSSSSMSNYSRAPTPSFLLSPDQSQTRSRPRPQNGAPETKLYHLSRSNGEAPIKLLVRLVGENGERVMVRVGGGWADLGEYLKEYASHHGRRNANNVDNDKIEIQDLPSSRAVSGASTVRGNGNGRSTPVPESRPVSAFDRPLSSLHMRKTRKSMGESDIRSPSTPLPMMNRPAFNETPPSSGPARSSSRMSWAEDDSSLGLAGPKSKKVAISERDQEWVESMKEKVRHASAEKERRDREREFGQMERVGGTKRLFRKT